MPSTNRMPYTASTPDRSVFDTSILLSPQVSYFPAPTNSGAVETTSYSQQLYKYTRRAREVLESNIGLLLVASAQLFFSLMNVGVKQLNSLDPPVPAVELIFVRMAITWVCCVSYMHIMNVPNPFIGPAEVRWFLVQRGLFGFVGIFGLYYSLQYLSLSDATVLQFLSPIFTAIAGAIFLNEAFSYRELLAGLTSLVGVVLIARPHILFGSIPNEAPAVLDDLMKRVPEDEVTPVQRLLAVGVALFGAVGAAGAYTTIRLIGKRAHALHNLVAYSMLCMIVTSIAMIALRIPVVVPMRWDWLLMLCFIGLAGFTGQVLLTMGLQRETAGRGSIAIVFATIFERIFLHTTSSPLSILGTLIIVSSALYVVLTKKTKHTSAAPSDDLSVEEGLLASHALDEFQSDAPESQAIVLTDNPQPKMKT